MGILTEWESATGDPRRAVEILRLASDYRAAEEAYRAALEDFGRADKGWHLATEEVDRLGGEASALKVLLLDCVTRGLDGYPRSDFNGGRRVSAGQCSPAGWPIGDPAQRRTS